MSIKLLVFILLIPACGMPGPQGSQGVPGPRGPKGEAANIGMIKFCPGYDTVYPRTFPEFGMCVSDVLYAVYWDKQNAWLAEVVPGRYDSTSTSAPCSFTVKPMCKIEP